MRFIKKQQTAPSGRIQQKVSEWPAEGRNTKVAATERDDKRVNIPTGDLSDFVSDTDGDAVLHERDPQLVWKGKDAEDLSGYLSAAATSVIQSIPGFDAMQAFPLHINRNHVLESLLEQG